MSVTTTADTILETGRRSLNDSIKNLGELVIDKPYGYDEFTPDAKKRFRKAYFCLIEARDTLDGDSDD